MRPRALRWQSSGALVNYWRRAVLEVRRLSIIPEWNSAGCLPIREGKPQTRQPTGGLRYLACGTTGLFQTFKEEE